MDREIRPTIEVFETNGRGTDIAPDLSTLSAMVATGASLFVSVMVIAGHLSG